MRGLERLKCTSHHTLLDPKIFKTKSSMEEGNKNIKSNKTRRKTNQDEQFDKEMKRLAECLERSRCIQQARL